MTRWLAAATAAAFFSRAISAQAMTPAPIRQAGSIFTHIALPAVPAERWLSRASICGVGRAASFSGRSVSIETNTQQARVVHPSLLSLCRFYRASHHDRVAINSHSAQHPDLLAHIQDAVAALDCRAGRAADATPRGVIVPAGIAEPGATPGPTVVIGPHGVPGQAGPGVVGVVTSRDVYAGLRLRLAGCERPATLLGPARRKQHRKCEGRRSNCHCP